MRFGVPYQGSKNAVACDIIGVLPSAPRFVDLFAGGCALTHAAAVSGKYQTCLANDIHPFGIDLFWNGLCGSFRNETRWISHRDFDILKSCDPFVAVCWSFGNNQKQYLYGEEIEKYKEALHAAYFWGSYGCAMNEFGLDLSSIGCVPVEKRAKAMWRICEGYYNAGRLPKLGKRIQMCYLQHLGRLRDVQSLEFAPLYVHERMKMRCGDYETVEIRPDDCIVCDIPYDGTCGYGEKDKPFDRDRFLKWAFALKQPVFVFEYSMPEGFTPIWGRGRWDTFGKRGKQSTRAERLWVQSRFAAEYKCDLFGFGKGGKV